MKKTLCLALAASLSLTACATTGSRLATAGAGIASLQAGYEAARSFAQLFLPFLPADRRAQIEQLGAGVEAALDAARTATTTAARLEALARAERAAADYRLATGN